MRSLKSLGQERAPSSTRLRLALGLIGVAVAAATVGVAASANAGGVPSPVSSDDVSYQRPASQESPSEGLTAVGPSSAGNGRDSDRPADLTPEDVQRLKDELKIAKYPS